LRGIAASPGQARGRVRIIRDPAASLEPRPGSILVATCADAAWTPLFAVAGAVVVETGGLLCPASIIARELGIPSVIAVPGATSELREGEQVEVDGTNGTVARIGDAKAASGEAA
jgi:pyruvate,water dikinase